jgi:hypothetical protein
MNRSGRDELEVAQGAQQLRAFGCERGAPADDALGVGPPHVLGVCAVYCREPSGFVTLVEHPQQVDAHQFLDVIGHSPRSCSR